MAREPDDYQGCGSDEAWPLFDQWEMGGSVRADDTRAPMFTLPTANATLSGGPPVFAWQPTPTTPAAPFGDARCGQCPACGLATAHLPAIVGTAYDLQFSVDGAVAWRVITTQEVWSPSSALWSSWRGHRVSLVAVRALLDDNLLADGPYRATAPLSFSVD